MLITEWYSCFDDKLCDGLAVREAVFAHGGDGCYIGTDSEAMHLVLYENEKAVGYGRVSQSNGDFTIDALCVQEGFRNQGYGDFMLRIIIRRLFTSEANPYYAIGTNQSRSLFERLGFEEIDGAYNKSGFTGLLYKRSGDVIKGCKD